MLTMNNANDCKTKEIIVQVTVIKGNENDKSALI